MYAGRSAQRHLQHRHVELGIVGEHADHRARVHRGPGQVAVRPLDHHLVGLREAGRGGEDAPGVADGHLVAQELPGPGHGRGEVDRAEHQHPRRRRERVHEHGQLVTEPLAVRAVAPDAGQALGQHPPGVVVHRRVQPVTVAEGPAGLVVGPDDPARTDAARSLDHAGHRDGLARGDRRRHVPEFRVQLAADRLHQQVQDAAAGQADRERVVVADAVGRQHRLPGLADLLGHLVHGPFHATARHAAGDLALGGHGHRGPGLAGRAAERAHHRGQAEHLARVPPLRDRVQDVSQPASPRYVGHVGPGAAVEAWRGGWGRRAGPAGAYLRVRSRYGPAPCHGPRRIRGGPGPGRGQRRPGRPWAMGPSQRDPRPWQVRLA